MNGDGLTKASQSTKAVIPKDFLMDNRQHVSDFPPRHLPWVTAHGLPFDTDEDLLSWFFEATAYKAWLSGDHPWSLRVVGLPGTGKTTLSAMVLRDLRQKFPGSDVGIVSMFFVDQSDMSASQTSMSFLSSFLSQLKLEKYDPLQYQDLDVEMLRSQVVERISQLKRTFLVLDDFDLCSNVMNIAIEKEMVQLQLMSRQHGSDFNIISTSRIPKPLTSMLTECDAKDIDCPGVPNIALYWICQNCPPDFETESEYIICQSCRNKSTVLCPTCHSSEHFIEPYDTVRIDLVHTHRFRRFIARELERTHGDLNLGSDVVPKPPLSALGRSIAKAHQAGSGTRILDDIEQAAKNNVAFAKLLLDQFQHADALEDIERVSDRLDDDQVIFFESLIQRISNQKAKSDRDLGLAAVAALASEGDYGEKPFFQLEEWLQGQNLLGRSPEDTREYNLNRVLHAACGLILVGDTEENILRLYHENFAMYVLEGYDERIRLVRQTTSLDEV